MSDHTDQSQTNIFGQFRHALQPFGVILGTVVGFVLCVWLGVRAEKVNVHKDFTRFHPMISPESLYQPTVSEMTAIVRARVPRDKILVIVGGNSILFGVGQPADEMWTRKLQALLGDDFRVINFAFRGSVPTDGGAVIAEVLRNEYRKLIYIANEAPGVPADPIGSETYRFIFWEAYFKGLLLNSPPREERMRDFLEHNPNPEKIAEIRRQMHMDQRLHFKALWHNAAYESFFPVWNFFTPNIPGFIRARKIWPDAEGDFRTMNLGQRYKPEFLEVELSIVRNFSLRLYESDGAGGWKKVEQVWRSFEEGMRDSFPDPLKRRTLIMLSRNSPFYMNVLNPLERSRDELAFKDSVEAWRRGGYFCADYGKDFTPLDYGDRTHLAVSGGEKLAAIVAPIVKEMSVELGYGKPSTTHK